jgi:inhibitor of KinA
MHTLKPLGDSALLVTFGDEIDPRLNQQVHALAALLDSLPLAGIIETVPAYATR